MAKFNKVNKKTAPEKSLAHMNYMGGVSFDLSNPILRLRLAASSTFFGEPKYYLDSEDKSPRTRAQTRKLQPIEIKQLRDTLNAIDPQDWRELTAARLLEKTIDEALACDAEATLALAAELRRNDNIRVTPQVILVRAAHQASVRGSGLIGKYAGQIIRRADEPATGLAYQLASCGKSAAIPNSLKRAWRSALERFSAYELAKYRLESRQVKTVDVVNLVHPKSEAINLLVRGELKTTAETWESIISQGGSSPATWLQALDVMGHMALLRNCRNLLNNGVNADLIAAKLLAGAKSGKQLPFRYYSAYVAVRDAAPLKLLAALEDCLADSLKNIPRFNGRTMCLVDNSGSAQGSTSSSLGKVKISTIGNLTGCIAAMRSDEGYLGVFGDRLKTVKISAQSSIFKQLDAVEAEARDIGLSTENGIWLFFDQAIKNRERWDNIFVFSDMQAGHGGLYGLDSHSYAEYAWNDRYIDVSKLIRRYRERVNPLVMIYLVQIAGYQDTLVPEFYDRSFILGGWGEGIFRFAHEMEAFYQG